MNKKDRIAVVLSTILLLVLFYCFIFADREAALLWLLILSAYWGYRFIKNDISFVKMEEKE